MKIVKFVMNMNYERFVYTITDNQPNHVATHIKAPMIFILSGGFRGLPTEWIFLNHKLLLNVVIISIIYIIFINFLNPEGYK